MNIQSTNQDNLSTYYINQFYTNRDPYNSRKNLYVDIRYGELNINFNENKVIMDFVIHIAGSFNLPPGSILANIIMPGQTINAVSLYKQNVGIPGGFQYGFPDASSVYYGRVILDLNEDQFLSNNANSSFQINLNFDLNTSQLDGISETDLNPNNLSNFISNLKNITLTYDVNLYQKNSLDLTESNLVTVNQINSIWVSSQVKELNNSITLGNQTNTYLPFQFLVSDYSDYETAFRNLFSIKKMNNTAIKVEVQSVKVRYYLQNQLYETNDVDINDNFTIINSLYNFTLTNYQIAFDSSTNSYQLVLGNDGIYFNENISGYYLIIVKITINGSSRTYTLKNSFNFLKNSKVNITYISNSDGLKILSADDYYEIEA